MEITFPLLSFLDLYCEAKEKGELSTAARCLELLGRHVGAFEKDNKQKGTKVVIIQNFNYDEKMKEIPPGSNLFEN